MAIKYKDMAIEFKTLQKKIETDPLSESELALIKAREDFIDKKITEEFGMTPYREVRIEAGYVDFTYDLKGEKEVHKHGSIRKRIMQKELQRRYKEAGWKMDLHMDDMLDGPNMSGPDYWVLKGKK